MSYHKPHKSLESWKLSFDIVKEIYLSTKDFPSEEKYGITSQMRRCAISIPSNIAEGAARNTKKEFINFLYISLGSLSELDTLILLSNELGYLSKDIKLNLLNKLDIIGKLIYGLIQKLKTQL